MKIKDNSIISRIKLFLFPKKRKDYTLKCKPYKINIK